MNDKYLKIYEDFSNWLKFIEAKMLALFTIQIGVVYYILEMEQLKFKIIPLALGLVGISLLLHSLLPKIDYNSENILYYGSWINNYPLNKSNTDFEKMYERQCKDIAKLIDKKSKALTNSCLFLILELISVTVLRYCDLTNLINLS